MMSRALLKEPQVVFKNGRPTAVILEIKKFREILERLEDLEDLKELKTLKRKTLKFRGIEEFLKDHSDV